jgi:hypothetical protein
MFVILSSFPVTRNPARLPYTVVVEVPSVCIISRLVEFILNVDMTRHKNLKCCVRKIYLQKS